MKVKKIWLIVSIVSVMLIVSACGKSNMDGMDMSNGNMDMGDSSDTTSDASSSGVVNVTASNWKWELSQTTFKTGETITFSIQGKEGLHGFAIDGTDVDEQIAAGETKEVSWTPDKAGEYTIRCSVACGAGHANMVQTITVTD